MVDELIKLDDYDFSDIQRVLDNTDYVRINFKEMIDIIMSGNSNNVLLDTLNYIVDSMMSNVNFTRECIFNIVIIIIFSAFFSGFSDIIKGKSVTDTGFYVCYIAVMVLSIKLFATTIDIGGEMILLVLQFMKVLIPSFLLSVGVLFQGTAISFYEIVLFLIWAIENGVSMIIIPLLKIYLILSLSNSISREDMLSKAIELIRRAIIFLNKASLGVITGINALQALILPGMDNLKNTTIKKLAGAIPVVGDSSEYVTDIFIGSAVMIKNSFGVAAIMAIIIMGAIPVIKISLISMSLHMSAALTQPVGDKRMVGCISGVADTIGLLLRTVITVVILFVITIALVCIMTGKT